MFNGIYAPSVPVTVLAGWLSSPKSADSTLSVSFVSTRRAPVRILFAEADVF
jgi:hypothetical protein